MPVSYNLPPLSEQHPATSLRTMANGYVGFHPQAQVTTLPPINLVVDMNNYEECKCCHHRFPGPLEFQTHQSQCIGETHAQQEPHYQAARHDSMQSIHSIHSPGAWATAPNPLVTQVPSPPSSVTSGSDCSDMVSIPARTTSPGKNKATKRQQRRSPAPYLSAEEKKAKKTEKEKRNRKNQGAVMYRMEDYLEQYCGWAKHEQSGGNGNSAGLNCNKINLLRVEEAQSIYLAHKARCTAILSGTLAEHESEMRAVAEAVLAPGYRPGDGTFLELPPGEMPCNHKDSKSKDCNVHGHPDWRECRKTRMRAIMESRQNAFLAEHGITLQQAMYGSRDAAKHAPRNMLPYCQSTH